VNAAALRQELAAWNVVLSISESGGLKYDAPGPVPAALVELLKEHKTQLIDELRTAEVVTSCDNLGVSSDRVDLFEVPRQPGHCGACALWEALPAPLAHMGLCSAGRGAHGWYDGPSDQVVEIHAAHACIAWEGKGFRTRVSGKSPAARPVAEVSR
jgi:hypothetical protein